MNRMFGVVLLFILGFITLPVFAGIEHDLEKFFNEVGSTNVSHGGSYKGQEGGFYTGGSLYMRNPSRSIQIINLQLPKVEAGCSGINLFTGGLGYINSQKFIETLKTIGANASGYA